MSEAFRKDKTMTSLSASTPLLSTRRARHASRLLGNCAIGALALTATFVAPKPAYAQSFQGTGTIVSQTPGSNVSVTNPTASTTQVSVGTSSQTVVRWDNLGAAPIVGGAIQFQAQGTTASFVSDTGNNNYIVLNRIIAPTAADKIRFDGNVNANNGGRIWFYTSGGIIVGNTARFDVGGLVLTTSDIIQSDGLLGPLNDRIRFSQGRTDASIVVEGSAGTQLSATRQGSYIALVAPRIEQAGNVLVNGSAAYVAAESAEMIFNSSSLFTISVPLGQGSADANGIVHTGTTTTKLDDGATISDGIPRNVYMVAVPKNQAMTMLLGGNIGGDAQSVSLGANGAVILAGGYGTTEVGLGDTPLPLGNSTGQVDVEIERVNFTSLTDAHVTGVFNVDVGYGDVVTAIDANWRGDKGVAVTVGDFGTLGVTGDLTLGGGNGSVGGDANLAISGTGQAVISGSLALDTSVQASGGSISGGNISLSVIGSGASLSVTSGTFLNSSAIISTNPVDPMAADPGTARGGNISTRFEGGTVALSFTNFNSGARFGSNAEGLAPALAVQAAAPAAGNGGNAIGGDIVVDMVAGSVSALTFSLDSSAFASDGAEAALNAAPFSAGNGTGGNVSLNVTGGTLNAGSVSLFSAGYGGNGQPGSESNQGGNTVRTQSGIAGNGQGGATRLTIDGGTLAVTGSLLVSSTGTAGSAGENPFGTQRMGGIGTGGTADLTVRSGTLSAGSIDVSAIGLGDSGFVPFGISSGGSGIGGTAMALLSGGTVTTGGFNVSASGIGGDGIDLFTANAGQGGTGTGGSGVFRLTGTNLTMTSLAVDAIGQGGRGGDIAGFVPVLAPGDALMANAVSDPLSGGGGGAASGGSALVDIGANNTIANVVVDVSSIGGDGGDGEVGGRGGDSRNTGTASFLASSGTTTVNNLFLAARGQGGLGGNGSSGRGGDGGSGTGGNTLLRAEGNGTALTVRAQTTGLVTLWSYGSGGEGGTGISASSAVDGSSSGSGFGGNIEISTGGTATITLADAVELNASGTGIDGNDGLNGLFAGNGGAGGLGGGGRILIAGPNASVVMQGNLDASVEGFGGSGGDGGFGSSSRGTGGRGGDALGGTIVAEFFSGASGNSINLSGRAVAGDGGSGSGGGDGGDAEPDETSNGINLILSGGSNLAAFVTLDASAVAGSGGIGDRLAGGRGGSALGGQAQASIAAGSSLIGNTSVSVSADADGGSGEEGSTGGAGGTGEGGIARFMVNGLAQIGQATLTANASGGRGGRGLDGNTISGPNGGSGGAGGSSSAGTASLVVSGAGAEYRPNFSTRLNAESTAGDGGDGGNGFESGYGALGAGGNGGAGGTAFGTGNVEIEVEDGQFAAESGYGVILSGVALGGRGGGAGLGSGSNPDGMTANSGDATGGRTSVRVTNASFRTTSLRLTSDARGGGDDGDNLIPGVGGAGLGGDAEFIVDNSTIAAGSFFISADGYGGRGGESPGSLDGARGGEGRGGDVQFSFVGQASDVTDITSGISLSAKGFGGNGGSGRATGNGGAGGAGNGGTAALIADTDPVIANIVIDTSGTGGIGGTGAVGGAGGTGSGGGVAAGTAGSIVELTGGDLTINAATLLSRGFGGEAGTSLSGVGAPGGSALGGVAGVSASGGTTNLVIDDLSIDVSAIGGEGGGAGGSSGLAGGVGGDATGGTASLVATADASSAITISTLLASGTGGIGGFGGSGTLGAAGGAGGTGGGGTGGAIYLESSDGASLITGFAAYLNRATFDSSGTGGAGGFGGFGGTPASFSSPASSGSNGADGATPGANGGNGGVGQAGATGANGGNGGRGGDGGSGFGGSITLFASNGGVLSPGDGADIFMTANGVGGDAGGGGFGGNGGGGQSGGAGGRGGNGAAGAAQAGITPAGNGGNGGNGGAGGAGGNAGNGGNGGDGGTVGQGNGGSILFDAMGGTIQTGNLIASVDGIGGRAGRGGGGGSGGTEIGYGGVGGAAGTGGVGGIGSPPGAAGASGTAGANGPNGSSGFGGFAGSDGGFLASTAGSIVIQSRAGSGSFGRINLGATILRSTPSDFDGFIFGTPGSIRISNLNADSSAPAISFSSLDATVEGNFGFNPLAGILIEANEADVLIAGDANLISVQDIAIRATGEGQLTTFGSLTGYAQGGIAVSHQNRPEGAATLEINGELDLAAGFRIDPNTDEAFYQLANLSIGGRVSAFSDSYFSSGGSVVFTPNAQVETPGLISISSGDDIVIGSGSRFVSSPDFGYGNSFGGISIDAGSISPIDGNPSDVASFLAGDDSQFSAIGTGISISGEAIQAKGASFESDTFQALVFNAPDPGVAGSNDGGQLDADCIEGNACIGTIDAVSSILVGPPSGTSGLANSVSIRGAIDSDRVSIRSRDTLTFGDAESSFVVNGSSDLFLESVLGDIRLRGGTDVTGGSSSFALVAENGSILGLDARLLSDGDVLLNARQDIRLSVIDAAGQLGTYREDTSPLPLIRIDGTFSADVLRVDTGNVDIGADAGISLGSTDVSGNMTLTASNGPIEVLEDARVAGTVNATGTSVDLNSLGNLTLGTANATAGRLSVNTNGLLTINQLAAGRTILLGSFDIAIGANARVGAVDQTTGISLTNFGNRQTYIGGNGGTGTYGLSDAEFQRVYGNNVTVFVDPDIRSPESVGQSPQSINTQPPNVILDTLTLRGANGQAGVTAGNIGTNGTLRIETDGKLRTIGAVTLTNLTAGNRFEIAASDAIEVDPATGSISLQGASNALAGTLFLSSDDIISASPAALAAVAATTDIGAIDTRLGTNDGSINDQGVLRANTIQVDVGRGFYVQNTGAGTEFDARRGITVGSGGLSIQTESTTTRIVINGRQLDTNGSSATGVSWIPLVRIGATSTSRQFDPGSTINGCLIISTAACAGGFDSFDPGNPDRDILDRNEDNGPGGDRDTRGGDFNLLPFMLIELKDAYGLPYQPIIDDPVTGSGNDDLWAIDDDDDEEEDSPK